MIKLKRLLLENFCCIDRADLEFENYNSILLCGDNGSGKSSVLDAVALCFSDFKRSDTYKEYIKTGKKTAKIDLFADYNSKDLEFHYEFYVNGGSDKNATYDGKLYKNSEIAELIKSLNLDFYSNIILSMQGNNDVVTMKPNKRTQYISKLLQFDFTDAMAKITNTLQNINADTATKNALCKHMNDEISHKNTETKEVPATIYTQDQIDGFNQKLKDVDSKLAEFKIQQSDLLNKSKQKSLYEMQLSTKKVELEKNITIDNNIKDAKSEIEKLNNSLSQFQDLETDTLTGQLTILQDDLDINNEDLNSTIESLNNFKIEKKQLDDKLELIKAGKCPKCGAPTSYMNDDNFKNQIVEVDSNIEKYIQLKKELQESIEKQKKEIDECKNKISIIKNQNAGNKAHKEEILKNVKIQQDKLITYNSFLRKDVATLKNEISELENNISNLNNVFIDSQKTNNEIETLTKEKDTYQGYINFYNENIININSIVMNNSRVDSEIKVLQQKLLDETNNLKELESKERIYDDAKKILKDTFPQYLILKTCNKLEAEINNVISMVFPKFNIALYQSKSGIEFFYTKNPGDDPMNVKMASGFERAVLSVAFKIALCKAYNMKFVALDEVDAAASDANSEKLFNAILANNMIDQIFIITHKTLTRDLIKSISQNIITYNVSNGRFTVGEDND